MQIKTTMSNYFIHTLKWLKLERLTTPSVGEAMEQFLCIDGGKYNKHFGEQSDSFF